MFLDAEHYLEKDDTESEAVDPKNDNIESESEEEDEEEFYDCSESFEIEVEPTFTLPYSVAAESDPACVLMDKLIREGKLSKNSYFYKNFLEVAKHLENPKKPWDHEICEGLLSIKYLGGKAAMNYVIGPLSRGQGSEGKRDLAGSPDSPVLNYGGPGNFVLQKYVSGTMPISGISKHNLLSCLRILELSEVKTANPKCEVFSVSLQLDGTMLRAGLVWDVKLGLVIGCKDPMTYQDLENRNFHLSGEFLKKNLVTEVDVVVLESLCSNVSMSLGYVLQTSGGKTGPEIIDRYTKIIKSVSKCESCVRSKPANLNTIDPELVCCSFCQECWTEKNVCEDCRKKGRKTIYSQLEPCFQCLDKGIVCRKALVQVLALDCFSGNRFLIENFRRDFENDTKDAEVYLTEPIGEILHILKTIKSSYSNWFLMLSGNLINLAMLRTLRDDNANKGVAASLRKVLQKGSVVNRDRQDTDCLIEFSEAIPVLRDVVKIDPVVVHTVCPEKYKLEPSNKSGSLGPVSFIGAVNIGHIAVISDDKKDEKKSLLALLDLHSPVRIKTRLELPRVLGFGSSETMIVIRTDMDLMFIEIIKGTVVPKIPAKKTEQIALCKDLGLSCEGNVKDLKARLIKKLKPTSNLVPLNIHSDSQLLKNLRSGFVFTKCKLENGQIKSLVLADNGRRELASVVLEYKKGSVYTKTSSFDFPSSFDEVKLLTSNGTVTVFVSLNQLTIVDDQFQVLSVCIIELPLTDVCCISDTIVYIQDNKVCSENLENLKNNVSVPKVLAGSGSNVDKDGSGLSSSFAGLTSIASYQNSIIVGASSGKVKTISDVGAIADFFENTFDVGVKGFGLHKKAGGRQPADLESSKEAHERMFEFLKKLTEDIRTRFSFQTPVNLNGPEHSVSGVTLSTVELAGKSFAQIQKNVKLSSHEGLDLTSKVNPSSTTTKGVEHFHSFSHRKKDVQTVDEYIKYWAVIVREYSKSLASWSFQMFSGFKSSYYLKPEENRIPLCDIPMMPKLPNMNRLSVEENRKAKEVCLEHKALPQSSTRTFTSKFKAGTLPLQSYLIDNVEAEDDTNSPEDEIQTASATDVLIDAFVDEPHEWDSGSSEDEDRGESEDDSAEDVVDGFNHFNQRRVTRSGREIFAAKHFMFEN